MQAHTVPEVKFNAEVTVRLVGMPGTSEVADDTTNKDKQTRCIRENILTERNLLGY